MARGTCWQGFEQKGFKKKGNRSVPNCVRAGKAKGGLAQQAIHPPKPSSVLMALLLTTAHLPMQPH